MTDDPLLAGHALGVTTPEKVDPVADLPMGFRSAPHNIEAEQGLLGAVLVNNQPMATIADYLRPEHFYEPVHARIYAAMLDLYQHDRIIDHITLKTAFDEDEALKSLDGGRYLGALAKGAVTILNGDDYARLIRDLAQRRALADICRDGLNAAMDQSESMPQEWTDIVARLTAQIDTLNTDNPDGRSWSRGEALRSMMAQLETYSSAISTGLRHLDASMDGGLRFGCSYCIEAPSGANKSTMLAEINEGVLEGGHKTHYFTLEQSPEELLKRLVASEAPVNINTFEKEDRRDRSIREALDFYGRQGAKNDNGRYDHVPGIRINDLIARMTRSVVEHDTKVFFLDYFTKITGNHPRDNKAQFYEEASDRLDSFCQLHNVVLVIALQQNRQGESLWGDGPKRKCSWLGKLHKVESPSSASPVGSEAHIWIEVGKARHGPGGDVGSKDNLLLKVVTGPRIIEL